MKNNFTKSILIIEDDHTSRNCYQILKLYANLIIYENPKEALNNANIEAFDLIITDLLMPYISGYDFIKMLRERNINTPIIVVSAFPSCFEYEEAFSVGASDFISKPITPNILLVLVFKYLNININELDSHISESLKLFNEFSLSNNNIRNSLDELFSKKQTKNIFQLDDQYIVYEINKTIEEFGY